jgi:hypothetical protein
MKSFVVAFAFVVITVLGQASVASATSHGPTVWDLGK